MLSLRRDHGIVVYREHFSRRRTGGDDGSTGNTCAYITGWRIDSEVLPLEWRQVDFGAGEVRLDPGKTKNGERRTFPMTRELREVLEQQRAITENLQRQLKVVCPRVFHRSGRPVKSFRVAFRSACKEAGCLSRSGTKRTDKKAPPLAL